MGSVAPQPDAPKILLTGIYGLRDVVLALPRLSALRAQHPDANITIVAPAGARDLLLRLKLVDHVRVLDDRSVMSILFWGWWQRLRRGFDRVIDGAKLEEAIPPAWHTIARDMSYLLPPAPFVLFALPDGFPALRAAALLRKLELLGYHSAFIGERDSTALDRLGKAAPDARNLVGRVDLSDIPALAASAAAVIGGRDAMTTLAALSGARTLILSQGSDDAVDQLPVANTLWLQSDDLSYVGVGDIIKAVLP